jgi:tetratricopeptide (TPR) repeat protein
VPTRVEIETIKARLTESETQQVRAALLFDVPVPQTVLEVAGRAIGVAEPERALVRLLGLGLLDAYGPADKPLAAQVNRDARQVFDSLSQEEAKHLAEAVVSPLFDAWADATGNLPADSRAITVTRLAILAEADVRVINKAALPAAGFLFRGLNDAYRALDMVIFPAVTFVQKVAGEHDLRLVRIGAECAARLGDVKLQDQLFEWGFASSANDAVARAQLQATYAERLKQKGEIAQAIAHLQGAAQTFESLGDVRGLAVTKGKVADILHACGDLDGALTIRTEEELATYEKLGDLRESAVTKGKIADILHDRGDLDSALKIRIEEQLPAFEMLGEVREWAVAKGRIADILDARGDRDGALKIRIEEELPIYEKLDDARSMALTKGKIADILHARGDLEGALKIRTEEELPIFEMLGDVRERAVTQGKIADILHDRGDLDAVLKIRTEEELPIYEKLGEVRAIAVTKGKIAEILQARGDLDGALKIRTEEELPIYERLGELRAQAIVNNQIAEVFYCRGDIDTALKISTEQLAIFEKLGDARSLAATKGKIADFLFARGDLDAALKIRTEEELPTYEKLGEVRSVAVAKGKIADIFEARGELDKAFKIRTEEQLPIFEKLGDVRELAVLKGRMADTLAARGDLDGAIRLHLENMPTAERMRDAEMVMGIRFRTARLRLAKGLSSEEEMRRVHQDLLQSYGIAHRIGRPDAIVDIGVVLAGLLASAGAEPEAVVVGEEVAATLDRVGRHEYAERIRRSVAEICGTRSADPQGA